MKVRQNYSYISLSVIFKFINYSENLSGFSLLILLTRVAKSLMGVLSLFYRFRFCFIEGEARTRDTNAIHDDIPRLCTIGPGSRRLLIVELKYLLSLTFSVCDLGFRVKTSYTAMNGFRN